MPHRQPPVPPANRTSKGPPLDKSQARPEPGPPPDTDPVPENTSLQGQQANTIQNVHHVPQKRG